MDTHTDTHFTTPEFPQGRADRGSIKTGKWPNNKEAQLDEVRRMDLLPENLPAVSVWVCIKTHHAAVTLLILPVYLGFNIGNEIQGKKMIYFHLWLLCSQ